MHHCDRCGDTGVFFTGSKQLPYVDCPCGNEVKPVLDSTKSLMQLKVTARMKLNDLFADLGESCCRLPPKDITGAHAMLNRVFIELEEWIELNCEPAKGKGL